MSCPSLLQMLMNVSCLREDSVSADRCAHHSSASEEYTLASMLERQLRGLLGAEFYSSVLYRCPLQIHYAKVEKDIFW